MRLSSNRPLQLFKCLLLTLMITSVAYSDTVLQMHALSHLSDAHSEVECIDGTEQQ